MEREPRKTKIDMILLDKPLSASYIVCAVFRHIGILYSIIIESTFLYFKYSIAVPFFCI